MNIMAPVTGPPKNQLRTIGEKPSGEAFKPIQIVHARLLLVPLEANSTARLPQRMTFKVDLDYRPSTKEISPEEAHAFAQDVADGKITRASALASVSAAAPSPYDIGVLNQCWVVLELEKEWTNWQFEAGQFVVTTKEDYGSDNHTLRYAYERKHPNGSDTPGEKPIPADGCRVVYFGVAKREFPQSQFFNIHTEFLQDSPIPGGEQHRLRVIFDPDVPNSGPDAIPP